jgi:hypothetical protein
MIVEGLIATRSADGSPHLSALGAIVEDTWDELELRPFVETQTFANLRRHPQGVFHTTDDVDLIVRVITGARPVVDWIPATHVSGSVLADCCRFFEFEVAYCDPSPPRGMMRCRVAASGERRPAVGFNRAKHLILEAAILATRVHFLPHDELREKWHWFDPIIRKTGSPADIAAFSRLSQFVAELGTADATHRGL